MANKSMSSADYLLLLLYLNNKAPIYGAIRITKMMFLFNKEIAKILKKKGLNLTNPPIFIPYNYGPFSKDVYEQIELFRGIGFIKVTNVYAREELAEVDDWEEAPFINETVPQDEDCLQQDGKYYKYEIAKTGTHYVKEKLLNELSPEQIDLLKQFKAKITSLSPKQILRYVYKKYPEFTDKSLIRDEVLSDEG